MKTKKEDIPKEFFTSRDMIKLQFQHLGRWNVWFDLIKAYGEKLNLSELEAAMVMIKDTDRLANKQDQEDTKRLIEASLVEMIDPSYDPEIV